MKTISVIVPVYNVEKYLEKCIESICEQTYKQLEIILVDDGSPDSCGSICEKFKDKDKRVKVIHQENGGLSDARNSGIKIATGEYIAFVDSDDFIFADMYEELVNVLEKNNADIAVCNYQRYTEGTEPKQNKVVESIRAYSGKEAIFACMEKDSPIFTPIWNKLYKAELFKDIHFPKGRNAEDVATIYKLYYRANRIVYASDYFYCYCVRNNSLARVSDYQAEDSILAVEERTQFFINTGEQDIAIKSEMNCMRMLIWFYVRVCKNNKKLSDELRIKFEKKYDLLFQYAHGNEYFMFRVFHWSPLIYRTVWSLFKGIKK